MMDHTPEAKGTPSDVAIARRKLLAALGAGGATWLLDGPWRSPHFSLGILPAHAGTSADAGAAAAPPATATPVGKDASTGSGLDAGSDGEAGTLVPGANNPFRDFDGELKINGECDDEDGKFTLTVVDDTTFVVTGLGDNGPITFRVTNPTTGEAEGVNQFGKPGHKVVFKIVNGKIEMSAVSTEGSCAANVNR